MKKRLFVAINFDPTTRLAIARLLSQVPNLPGLNKTKIDNLHLTLLFLGDTDDELIPQLSQQLDEISQKFGSLSIKFGGMGAFPNLAHPQIIWVGLTGSGLDQLQQEIANRLLYMVPTADTKPFQPHLTLARINNPSLVSSFRQIMVDLPPATVSQIDLMESILTPSGPVYRRISAHRLQNPV